MTMAFDYKKEYKEFYLPPRTPGIVTVPAMHFLAVRGRGDPNEENGTYKQALGLLYAVAYTIKMSKLGKHRPEGYFDYVVPPLEGFWQTEAGVEAKDAFQWISVIRLPDFVTRKDLDWAVRTAEEKKKMNCSAAEFMTVEEGLCVQSLHIGPFNEEPQTIARMEAYLRERGYQTDFTEERLHHEIYMSDARKVAPEKWKTVIRHPIKERG